MIYKKWKEHIRIENLNSPLLIHHFDLVKIKMYQPTFQSLISLSWNPFFVWYPSAVYSISSLPKFIPFSSFHHNRPSLSTSICFPLKSRVSTIPKLFPMLSDWNTKWIFDTSGTESKPFISSPSSIPQIFLSVRWNESIDLIGTFLRIRCFVTNSWFVSYYSHRVYFSTSISLPSLVLQTILLFSWGCHDSLLGAWNQCINLGFAIVQLSLSSYSYNERGREREAIRRLWEVSVCKHNPKYGYRKNHEAKGGSNL